ncbi:glycosyltransferase family 32 protein [Lactiplantibacillus plantarum]|uniref:glycosyltransferase family 32 protein n=1 Tax=Lactiplantibacillus plantarum TaxID=1590 RepID=UPI003EBB00A9
MIPKIIHYAWFGSEIPDSIQIRVNSWKEQLPDWKFMFWNEKNFDISSFTFSSEMYRTKNWGFIADELRYSVVNKYGGFYLDTDMIIKKSLNPLLNNHMVWGFLYDNSIATGFFGSEPNQELLSDILKMYRDEKYHSIYTEIRSMTSNPIISKLFLEKYNSFKTNGKKQIIEPGIVIYPRDYFTYNSRNSDANFAEHLFDNSWGEKNMGVYGFTKYEFKKLFPYLWAQISAYRGIKSAEADGVPLQH